MDHQYKGMDNILRQLRKQLHMTQEEVANAATVTPLAVLRYEQGLYARPSSSIVRVLAQATGTPENDIIQRYKADILWHRRLAEANVLYAWYATMRDPDVLDPFLYFRKTTAGSDSRMAFCKFLAVHPAVVEKYEKSTTPVGLPSQIREALVDAQLPTWRIDFLETRQQLSYELRNGMAKNSTNAGGN